MYHDGECFHCDSEQKDAENAELRAQRELLAGQLALADGAWGPKEWIKWAKKKVAALTPKEGT